MDVILDTHPLLWWLLDHSSLTSAARKVITPGAHRVFVSAATAWEIATKVRLGKLSIAQDLASNFPVHCKRERFQLLDISTEHALRAGSLPGPHRDPFDRMLIAQAQASNRAIVSKDKIFDDYKIERIW